MVHLHQKMQYSVESLTKLLEVFLKNLFFEKYNSESIDERTLVTEQYNERKTSFS